MDPRGIPLEPERNHDESSTTIRDGTLAICRLGTVGQALETVNKLDAVHTEASVSETDETQQSCGCRLGKADLQ